MSAADYIGSSVRITTKSGEVIEGSVTKINSQSISLTNVKNKPKGKFVRIESRNIKELDIISLQVSDDSGDQSNSPDSEVHHIKQMEIVKPITIMKRETTHAPEKKNVAVSDMYSNRDDRSSPESGNPGRRNSPLGSPKRISTSDLFGLQSDGGRNNETPYRNMKETFSVAMHEMTNEFDMQYHNKLFDKDALFDEWRQKDGGSYRQQTDKLKSSEMVIPPRQLEQHLSFEGEFETDERVQIKAMTLTSRISLFKAAINKGLNYSHVVSVAGVTIAQMLIQVLGGSCRINHRNHNNPPQVVFLVSGGDCGKVAVTSALHLHQHNVNVNVIAFSVPRGCEGIMRILEADGCVLHKGLQQLPDVIDLIVDAIHDRGTLVNPPQWYTGVVGFLEKCQAPVLCIDPQYPSQLSFTPPAPKWTCIIGAPLLTQINNSRLYLVDIGLPKSAFKDQNIPYAQPFMDKFIIPIYKREKS